MIHRIGADFHGFRNVVFRPGLNLVLADRTEISSEKDSRNGLGKTSLIHIIHFCLGGSIPDHYHSELGPITFEIQVDVGDNLVTIIRSTDDPGFMRVHPTEWLGNAIPNDLFRFRVDDVVRAIGEKWFSIPERSGKHMPSARALLNYFARRGHDAYVEPLKYFHSQPAYQQQILGAYLTGIDWEYPRQQRILKEEEDGINALRKAVNAGVLGAIGASSGELRAKKVTLERRLSRINEMIVRFKVHPRYRELEQELVQLSEYARETANELAGTRRLMRSYEESLQAAEAEMSGISIERLYNQAGVELGDSVIRTIEEVRAFHRALTEERSRFLRHELEKARQAVSHLEATLGRLEADRRAIGEMLSRYGAIDELHRLEAEARQLERELGQVDEQIATRSRIDTGVEHIRIRRVENREAARKNLERENAMRDRVIELFDEYWEELYGSGARLAIDVTDSGYRFDWGVSREGSEGVGRMKIFVHDLAVATTWHENGMGPGFLLHDSSVWDGVDERQVSAGLRLVQRVADRTGLQYITFFNTDDLPANGLLTDEWHEHVVLRLTDATPEGRLFGTQF